MTILKIILGISAMLTLIGCTTPIKLSDIPPQYISDLMYSHYNCEQIRHERARLVIVLASVLERASQVEWKARLRRISEVLGDESPTATLPGGNQASYLARLKGELIAIEKAANLKDCLDRACSKRVNALCCERFGGISKADRFGSTRKWGSPSRSDAADAPNRHNPKGWGNFGPEQRSP